MSGISNNKLYVMFIASCQVTLDESTARRHLMSPQSLCGRSLQMTSVTKWSWSWMTYTHPLCSMSIGHPIMRYNYFKIWPWKSLVNTMLMVKGLGHISDLENSKIKVIAKVKPWWSHLRPKVQSICLLFVSWQSHHFGLRYSQLHIWPWKIKVKIMA